MKKVILIVLVLLVNSVAVFAQSKPMLFRQPTMNATHIVFSFGGDLWKVPRTGGKAIRLTSGKGIEQVPMFSPDGNWIAFSGQYDGNTDAFVIPANGGEPKRLTYHPGNDTVIGWSNDEKSILVLSTRTSNMPLPKMHKVAINGTGLPEELPFPMAGGRASFSPDGSKIAYMPLAPAFAQWKLYRGGRTTKIWIGNLSDSSVEEIPRQNVNDFTPMWKGNKIYFLSDRNGRNVTLFSYDTNTKRVKQEIRNNSFDLKSAAAGPGGIVYEQFGSINIFDTNSGSAKKININLVGDFPEVRPRYERVARRVSNVAISPNGKRAVFEARGEIISVPAKKGNPRNLTNTSGVAERDPAWSPDGKWIAYFSDESGEYALHLRDQSGMGDVKKISLGNPSSYFYTPQFSPDSKKILFRDKRLNIWYLDIATSKLTKVDTNRYENPFPVMFPTWSPDSKWITYTKQLKNRLGAVYVYSLANGKANQLTDGLSDARFAAFDRSGKYIYFTASTNAGPTTGWLDMSSFPFNVTRSVYAIVLDEKEKSPLSPESDEEKIKEDKPKTPPKRPKGPPKPKDVKIDFTDIDQRVISLPLANRNYVALVPGMAGTFFLFEAVPSSGTTNAPNIGANLHRFDLKTRKARKIYDRVTQFDVSASGKEMLIGQFPGRFTIASTLRPMKPGEGRLNTGAMEVRINPREEWRQMYREAWRIQRDFFYDPTFHGVDIKKMENRYEAFLDGIVSRNDLNHLFREMLGNLTVGHHNTFGGDTPTPTRYLGGLLGADYKIANGRYQFSKIYNGENWNPNLRAPLTQPGLKVKQGEYLIAVNGRDVKSTDNIYKFFEQTANRQIVIRVGSKPDGSDARNVTVVPTTSESALRRLNWIEDNRRKVSELSNGQIGYVYLPNTAGAGYNNFNRYYFAQIDKNGIVVDERFNGGGSAADYFISYMNRPLMNYWSTREGEDFTTPIGSIYGPKTMIVNEYSSSGGDLLPWLFRKAKIGPIVGKRTWGGLVGIYAYPPLIDGGGVSAPRVAFRNAEGELDVENKGVAPDIAIDLDPKMWRQGSDTQLERAVQVTLENIRKNPTSKPKNGAFPKYPKQE